MYLLALVTSVMVQNMFGQETYQKKVEILKEQKAKITQQ